MFRGKTDYMREIAQVLRQNDIKTATGPMPGGGWETQAWLAVASHQTDEAKRLYEQYLDDMVARSGQRSTDKHADFDAPETECPACGTKFQTANATRCPDCGLNFGG